MRKNQKIRGKFCILLDKPQGAVLYYVYKRRTDKRLAPIMFLVYRKPPNWGVTGGFLFQPYFFLKNLIMSKIRAITLVNIVTKRNMPSYVAIVITSLSGASRRSVWCADVTIAYFVVFVNIYENA